ncbi:MAG: DMT family transporter [Micropruina sp.]|nr:DMT family transporter [Micropruina sp.]
MAQRNRFRGYALAIVSALVFGAMPVLAVVAYAGGAGVTMLLFWRFALAALVLGPVAWVLARRGGERPARRAVATGLVMGGVLYAGQAALYFVAVQQGSAALAALLLYTYPALVALGSSLLARRPPAPMVVVALAVATVGVALALGPVDGIRIAAVLTGLGSALVYTLYILLGARTAAMAGTTTSALVFASAATTFAVAAGATGQLALPPPDARLPIVVIALVCTVLGVWFFLESMHRIGATQASLTSTLEPITSVLLSAVLLQTAMNPLQWVGAALVVVAAVLGIRSSAATPVPPE